MTELSVIIPAKNEERNIEKTIRSVSEYLTSHNISHEIITVTNDCTDRTDQIVDDLSKEITTLSHIKFSHGKGKGWAVKKGMEAAKGDYRLFMDADNSTTIDNYTRFKPVFENGYDVVIASIAISGAKVGTGSEPLWRRVFGKLGNLWIQIFAVPGIHDTQRGFKVFTARAAEVIFPKLTLTGWGFDVEVLALARKYKFKIKEVAINWHNDPNTHVGLKAYIEVLRETLTVSWNLVSGRYN